jgi:hypothetical protein
MEHADLEYMAPIACKLQPPPPELHDG